MNLIYILSFILVASSWSSAQPTNHSLLISCGLPKSTPTATSPDNRVWKSDDDFTFAPPNINTISSTATAIGQQPPYNTARIFGTPLTYTFSLTPGPKFLRFYFTSSTHYNNISYSQFFLSLRANNIILFKNFSPSLNSPKDAKVSGSVYEFYLNVGNASEKNLNLTFSPGDGANNNNNYGFINAVEIVPVPEGLYINLTDTLLKYVTNPGVGYTPTNNTALQTVHRLNVGGSTVDPSNDTGSMWRTWYQDVPYLLSGGFHGSSGGLQYMDWPNLTYSIIPPYVAPGVVYTSERIMGDFISAFVLKHNLTWIFQVDPGFDYLMRLHFCEMFLYITGSGQRVFNVYINSQMADEGLDVWASSGGRGVPIYRDYVIRIDGGVDGGNGTKVPLWLDLHPDIARLTTDVILNGVEILKLSESDGNKHYLAAPNPPQVASPPTPPIIGGSKHHVRPIVIGGAIGGTVLVSLFIFACVMYKRRTNKEILRKKTRTTNTSSKDKWAQPSFVSVSTASTKSSSLPSDICRRFSLAEIRVATCDFDEKLVIGKGGFGEVYKGSIDGGSTKVAIKRLNTTSKQGAHEFQTEIEMLSRLRHVHLVSLIGYCEDRTEMILVYEYMPRGTLRDHLMYKKPEINDNDYTPLSWKQRLNVCLGSARGLHYLHAGAKQLIIHRDVKSTNILIDDKWVAKVSDFGLSKVGPDHGEGAPTHVSTAVKGSVGYLDPEYYRRHRLTEKSDVYSFGVVLFEVLCARPVMNPNLPREQINLAMWAQSHYKNGTLHTIVDPNLTGQIAPECLRKYGEIAEMCVRDHWSDRPLMGDVVWGLEFALQLQETAEKISVSGDASQQNLDQSSLNRNVGDGVITNCYDAFTGSGENFSRSNVSSSEDRLLDSRTTMSISSGYPADMISGSVFSEIIDPKAR